MRENKAIYFNKKYINIAFAYTVKPKLLIPAFFEFGKKNTPAMLLIKPCRCHLNLNFDLGVVRQAYLTR